MNAYLELPSDAAFTVFMGTFNTARLSPDEYALFQYFRLQGRA